MSNFNFIKLEEKKETLLPIELDPRIVKRNFQ
jgi:hypothetical protein